MRIGEVLLMQEAVDAWVLTQALKEPNTSRLVSLLISRAQLDPDDGALALSQQLGYPAALQRHLERRDPACEHLIPPELVRRWVVLPLGRAKDGRLVVVARDPTPILNAALEHASKQSILLAVAPGIHLERLIRSIYGTDGADQPLPPTAPASELPEPPRNARGRTFTGQFSDGTPELLAANPHGTDRVDAALGQIDNAITLAAAERIGLAYAARRWDTSLLVAIDDGRALGRRGNGPRLGAVDAIELPLGEPSIVQIAIDTGHVAQTPPATPAQQHVDYLLDDPHTPLAAPVTVAGRVAFVLLVGDPLHGTHRDSLADLARLADALGAAHDRFARGR
jgi:type II secretion system (T2SS) protein E